MGYKDVLWVAVASNYPIAMSKLEDGADLAIVGVVSPDKKVLSDVLCKDQRAREIITSLAITFGGLGKSPQYPTYSFECTPEEFKEALRAKNFEIIDP